MKLFKLTDGRCYTRGQTLWGENVTCVVAEEGNRLCSSQVIHAYVDPRIASLLNALHADFIDPILWEAEGDVVANDGVKVGVKKLTTLKRIPLPVITAEQRAEISIRCALSKDEAPQLFRDWADNWLSGKNRSVEAADLCRVYTSGLTAVCFAALSSAKYTPDNRYSVAEALECVTANDSDKPDATVLAIINQVLGEPS